MALESGVIGVVGAGTMGAGIAEVAALNGHQVLLADADAGMPAAAIERIAERQRDRVERGKIARDQAEAAIACLVATDATQLTGCELIIEAVVEDLVTKVELLVDLESRIGDDVILASNTSSLSITELASRLQHPGRMAGLHFFNPVPAIKLVEVISGAATHPEVTGQLADLVQAWQKIPVQCTSTPGFIVNRVARPYYGEAFRALAEGLAPPEVIDDLCTAGGGFAMGPLQLADLVGQDVNQAANRSVWSQLGYDPWFRPSPVQDQLVAAGWLGRKSGRGIYDYGAGPGTTHGTQRFGPPAGARSGPDPAPSADTSDSVVSDGRLETPAAVGDPALAALVDQLAGAGIPFGVDPALGPDTLRLRSVHGDALIAVTDGRPATARAGALLPADQRGPGQDVSADSTDDEWVLVDLVPGVADRRAVGVTSSAGPGSGAVGDLVTILGRAGVTGRYIGDVPGLVLLRTVAMLINLAVEAAAAGVAGRAGIATAMQQGVRFPRDLFAWGDELGAARLVRFLDHLEDEHRDGHFRPCVALRSAARTGRPLSPSARQ